MQFAGLGGAYRTKQEGQMCCLPPVGYHCCTSPGALCGREDQDVRVPLEDELAVLPGDPPALPCTGSSSCWPRFATRSLISLNLEKRQTSPNHSSHWPPEEFLGLTLSHSKTFGTSGSADKALLQRKGKCLPNKPGGGLPDKAVARCMGVGRSPTG